ncbi:MAG: YbhN family protein [Anaerolineales bacterium]
MNPSLRRRLLGGLAFGFLVILTLALITDIRKVGDRLADFNWVLLPLILSGTLFNYSLRFLKFHYYLAQIGAGWLGWRRSLKLFVAGFPLAVTPGKVGEALKAVWLKQETGAPVARGVTVVLAERISDGLAVLALSTVGVISYPRYWPAFAAVLAFLVFLVVISQIRPLALWILHHLVRLPLVGRLSAHLLEFYEGAYALFRPFPTLVAVSLGTVAWFGEGLGFYLVLLGLGVAPGAGTLSIAVFTLAFSTIVGAVSALPGGLGAAELSITGMLSLLLGLDAGTAATATLIIRFATLWFGVGLGLLVWTRARDWVLLEPRSKRSDILTPSGPRTEFEAP